jgi:hypothetical protein
MKNGRNDVNKFWAGFRKSVIRYGISESDADWYVKWGEKFAISIKGRSLRKRTRKDIDRFLLKLTSSKNIRKWQIEQANEAITIPYSNHFKLPSIISGTEKNNANHNKQKLKDKEQFKDNLTHKPEIIESHIHSDTASLPACLKRDMI